MKKIEMIKKVLPLILASLFMFVSCTSIPKTVEEGDTLTIGEFPTVVFGYDAHGMNSNQQYFVEITIEDTMMGKTYTSLTDKNGFYSFVNLPASHTFKVIQLKLKATNGSYVTLNNPNFNTFTALSDKVLNLGKINLTFDGTKDYCSWQFLNHEDVKVDFKKQNLETQWYTKTVVDWPLLK